MTKHEWLNRLAQIHSQITIAEEHDKLIVIEDCIKELIEVLIKSREGKD